MISARIKVDVRVIHTWTAGAFCFAVVQINGKFVELVKIDVENEGRNGR